MGNPQAEPSMDEILASIRRIIAEEDDAPKERTPVKDKLETLELTPREQVETTDRKAEEKKPKKPSLRKKPVTEAVADTQTGTETGVVEDDGKAEITDSVEDFAPEDVVEAPVAETAAPEVSETASEAVAEEEAVDEALDDFETPKAKAQTTKASKMTAPKAASMVAEAVQARTATPIAEPVSEIDGGQPVHISAKASEAASSAFEALAENIRITDDGGKTLEDMVQTMLQPLLVQWLDQNLPRIVEEKVEEEVRRLSRRR